MTQNKDSAPPQPMIRFAGDWLPAHQVWKKLETITVAMETIDRFNADFPELASAETHEVVPRVKQRLKDISLRMPSREPETMELGHFCANLLRRLPPEQVLERVALDRLPVHGLRAIRAAAELAHLQRRRRSGDAGALSS